MNKLDNKKGVSVITGIIIAIITFAVISLFFFLGRFSRENELNDLQKQLNMANGTIKKYQNNSTTNTFQSSYNTSSKANTTTNNSIKEFKINEPITIYRGNEKYTVTFEGIRETNERNQFSKITPFKVIFVDYNYENISSENDVYVYNGYYKLLDDSGNVLDTYPISDDTRHNNSVPIGGKSKGCDAFAIMTDTKTLTLLYYDYGSKPLGKIIINL